MIPAQIAGGPGTKFLCVRVNGILKQLTILSLSVKAARIGSATFDRSAFRAIPAKATDRAVDKR
jgi:hypothetical protein